MTLVIVPARVLQLRRFRRRTWAMIGLCLAARAVGAVIAPDTLLFF